MKKIIVKMEKKVKTVLYIITFALLVVSAYILVDTYALFETEATGSANFDVGKWVIKVNNQTITDGVNESININYPSIRTSILCG